MENKLTVRPATGADLPRMLEIYAYARGFMARTGNPHQWGDEGYPSQALLEEDIAQGRSYVVLDQAGVVRGVFMFAPGPDPTYRVIQGGAWPDSGPYGVIHRIAGDGTVKGLLATAVDFCRRRCPALRIDTHEDNAVMRHTVEKNGFVPCGIIHLENGDPRIAYHRPPG